MSLRTKRRAQNAEINIAPLLDMVFILLIFFMVTTHFTKDLGLEIDKPSASSAKSLMNESIALAISEDGDLYFNGRRISLFALDASIRRALVHNPSASVMIVADKRSVTESLIEVYDTCKLAGADKIAVGTKER
ncbi:MAG: biopolymer transporter ExbD [Planctomycetes bacterium]|nr:biopolymer transporter ExbD [Planctomycetota bacterium]